jgi:polysaccharide biosynthesis PFTS motif protein
MFVDGYHEAFYQALIDLLNAHPDLCLFIKLKRPTSSQWHNFPKPQLELLDEASDFVRAGRVVVIHQDTDPYLPIAACDAALGMPYTSPVLAAVSQGKPGAYFDPLGLARFPSEHTYNSMTISSSAVLTQRIGEWLAGTNSSNTEELRRLIPVAEADFDLRAAIQSR